MSCGNTSLTPEQRLVLMCARALVDRVTFKRQSNNTQQTYGVQGGGKPNRLPYRLLHDQKQSFPSQEVNCSHAEELSDVARQVDWTKVLEASLRHEVVPFIYDMVLSNDWQDLVPASLRTDFLLQYHRTGLRNEVIHERLAELLRRLASRNIDVLLLKGAILAYRVYPRCELRGLGDIDLVVRERDFGALRRVLESCGYQTWIPRMSQGVLPQYAQFVRQISFGSQRIPPIEVHFRLLNYGMPGAQEPAWNDAIPLDFSGVTSWAPSPERFLLHLCLHAQQHAFAQLRLLVDIAVWWRYCQIDSDIFVNLTRRNHLVTAAYYSLSYTSHLLQLQDLQRLCEVLRPRRWKRCLFEHVWNDHNVRTLQACSGPRAAELPKAYLLGEAPLGEKLAFLWNVAFPPRAWIERSHGRRQCARWVHMARIFNGVRKCLVA